MFYKLDNLTGKKKMRQVFLKYFASLIFRNQNERGKKGRPVILWFNIYSLCDACPFQVLFRTKHDDRS